jgi:excisionase family DNA binding protein
MQPPTATTNTTPPLSPASYSDSGDFLTSLQVADLIACHPRTVTRLCVNGVLPATRLGPGRTSWRVRSADLMAFIHRYGHHEPATVAASPDPDQLAPPTPAPVLLTTERTPDGLLLVRPAPPPDPS